MKKENKSCRINLSRFDEIRRNKCQRTFLLFSFLETKLICAKRKRPSARGRAPTLFGSKNEIEEKNFSFLVFFSFQCQTNYTRALTRLQSQFQKSSYVGTFTPIWNLFGELVEKCLVAQSSSLNFYQDLSQNLNLYHDVFQKKTRTYIQKDAEISRTDDFINQLNEASLNVSKAKEQFYFCASELREFEKNLTIRSNKTNSKSKKLDRIKKNYKHLQEEYQNALKKYSNVRNDFIKSYSSGETKIFFLRLK